VICIDLSGNLEKYSVELMHESKKIFLVCTPEIPSLHLAREKYQYLQTLDLGDRVSILLNRCQKKSVLSPAQIEDLLGLSVQMTFPNEYEDVNRAMTQGTHVDLTSAFGRQCSALAHLMLDKKTAVTETQSTKKRFIEFFNVSPARYSYDTKKN
jgi:pilus assembly protein CpaE